MVDRPRIFWQPLKCLYVMWTKNYFIMQYHEASLLGQERARKSQHNLFGYAGFAFLTRTVKQEGGKFEPVGEKDLIALENVADDNVLVVVCDEDGYSKAQTKPMQAREARKIYQKMLADGYEEFKGDTKAVK